MGFRFPFPFPIHRRVRRLRLARLNRRGRLMMVSQIAIQAGMPQTTGPTGNHFVVADQNGNPLSPASIGWTLDPSLVGVSVVPDGTGFFFTCPAATPAATGNATATYTGGPTPITMAFPVTVSAEVVTGLELLQQ